MSNASSDTKDALRATLPDLVALHGVSGFEQSVVAYFQKRVGGLADQVEVETISVGVPRRYSYSPNEMIDLNDAVAAVRLLVRFVADMDRHGDLSFG